MSNDTRPAVPLGLSMAAVLNMAADVIERNGIALGEFYVAEQGRDPRDCPVCAMGAIAVAAGLHPEAWDDEGVTSAAEDAAAFLADRLGWPDGEAAVTVVGNWNDQLKDAARVAAELRAAAEAAAATPTTP